MPVIEELLNLVITFAIVLAPLWILLSRRRRMQQEQQQRRQQQQQRPSGQEQPAEDLQTAEAHEYPARGRKDESYAAEQRRRTLTKADRDTGTEAPTEKPIGRLEKMLRELLGIPDEEERERARRQQQARRTSAERSPRTRSVAEKRKADQPPSKPEVARHADVGIRSVLPESGSLSLSPGGMGPQHMRTAAGNLGAASSVSFSYPAVDSLGSGWRRIKRLPEFKRAVLLSELIGKPHSLKDPDEF